VKPPVRRLFLAGLAVLAISCTPGASPVIVGSPEGSRTSQPIEAPRWGGTIVSRSSHRLYVGGTCTTDWRIELGFTVRTRSVHGTGTAGLTSTGRPCPFPTAQLQIHRYRLMVSGHVRNGALELRLSDAGHSPSVGGVDLGGFEQTVLSTELRVRVKGSVAHDRVSLQAPDHDRGEFDSTSVVRLRCKGC
jgi:hypothetical protein